MGVCHATLPVISSRTSWHSDSTIHQRNTLFWNLVRQYGLLVIIGLWLITTTLHKKLLVSPSLESKQQPKWPRPLEENQPLTLNSVLKDCKTLFYVHIPKTAGTSINKKFLTDLGDSFFHLYSKEEGDAYVHKTKKPYEIYKKYSMFDHNNSSTPIFVLSAEKGIDYFAKQAGSNWNAEFGQTCFASIVRNPYEWVLSAANHMNKSLESSYGYFENANIQTQMTGFAKYLEQHTLRQELNPQISSGLPEFHMCLYTVDTIDQFIRSLYAKIFGEHNGMDFGLGRENVKPHSTNHSLQLETLVWTKYLDDLILYDIVLRHNGTLCW